MRELLVGWMASKRKNILGNSLDVSFGTFDRNVLVLQAYCY